MTGDAAARRIVTSEELASPLMPYVDAVAWINAHFGPLPSMVVELAESLGLVLAEDIVAGDDIPNFDNSAMDGYAVRVADLVDGLPLAVGSAVAPGVATKVMTGQPIPTGADAVVPWEDAALLDDGRVEITAPGRAGQYIRPRGSDIEEGELVISSGTILGPVEIGVAAALGRGRLRVVPRPRVAVLSTGDELVGVDEAVGVGRVRDSNGPLLAAMAEVMGASVTATAAAVDDPEEIAATLRTLAATGDLVITSGGASVGEKDWLRTILAAEGELALWRVAMRPGKPVAIGRLGGASVIILPGNPGAVVACSHVVLGRAIRSLAGRPGDPSSVPGTLGADVEGDAARTVIHPVTLEGTTVLPAEAKTSQSLSNALGQDGWLIVPPGGLLAGDPVDVEVLP